MTKRIWLAMWLCVWIGASNQVEALQSWDGDCCRIPDPARTPLVGWRHDSRPTQAFGRLAEARPPTHADVLGVASRDTNKLSG
jgi:hypothetical protein